MSSNEDLELAKRHGGQYRFVHRTTIRHMNEEAGDKSGPMWYHNASEVNLHKGQFIPDISAASLLAFVADPYHKPSWRGKEADNSFSTIQ